MACKGQGHKRYGLGVIATSKTDIRVAFSCLEASQIPEVFDAMYRGALDLLGS